MRPSAPKRLARRRPQARSSPDVQAEVNSRTTRSSGARPRPDADRFDGGPPKSEPLNQLVPLVEFKFDSFRGQYTAATANPGLAYVSVNWQVAAEAILPLNRAGGSGPGFRAQLLLFLDDLMPSIFGKPLLTDKAPEHRQIAW